jgi:hydrogenase nickel incorporation protein HypA/HybF
MHEMSLVRKVVDIVLSECEGKEVAAVRAVHLTIGEATDVIEEYVEDLFRFLARGTVAEKAEVFIARTPLTVRCLNCGDIFPIDTRDKETWGCPRCTAYQNYRLFSGREFRVDRIDVERSTPADSNNASTKADERKVD